MQILTVDFETYYDKDYSLTKIGQQAYVRDPRFQIMGVAVSLNGAPAEWYTGTHEKITLLLTQYPWKDSLVVAHNASFDGAILEWVLGFTPAKYFCTMHAARGLTSHLGNGVSLAAVADYYEIGTKGDYVGNMAGIRQEALVNAEVAHKHYAEYCRNDVDLTVAIYQRQILALPDDEAELINLTVKKFVRPKLYLDAERLTAELVSITKAKSDIVDKLPFPLTKADIVSNTKFLGLLQTKGIELPTRVSPTGKSGVGLSRKDPEFMKLVGHENPYVRQIVKARLELKSSIRESRTKALLELAVGGAPLSVPLLYYGAHTGRLSGSDGLNLQNLPRRGELRKCLVAPPGSSIVTVDLSAIEARITATLAGCIELVRGFREGRDVYSEFATDVYGYKVSKGDPKTETERFVGKTCILGLGYGMGAERLRDSLLAFNVDIPLGECAKIVKLYRSKYREIKHLWVTMDGLCQSMQRLRGPGISVWGPVAAMEKCMRLPNGMYLHYPNMTNDHMGLNYTDRHGAKIRLWGGSITENVVQALARIIISDAELRLAKHGLEAVLQVHDELVYVVKDEYVGAVSHALKVACSKQVAWLPDLPVACEVKSAKTYGDAK